MRKVLLAALSVVAALVVAPAAFAGNGNGNGNGNNGNGNNGNGNTNNIVSVNGAVYTTIDVAVDGTGHCQNSQIDCNIYTGKQYVWLNGGPTANHLSPPGVYFFVVLKPGGQPDPNDASTDNLSCRTAGCLDPYTNRMFTIGANGEVSSYTGTHDQDSNGGNGILIRLCNGGGCPPYLDTPNPGGEYDVAVCYLGPDTTDLTYPIVTNKECKHDNFKVRSATTPPDHTPPVCSFIQTIPGPPKQVQVEVQDTDWGLNTIVTHTTNATVDISAYSPGDTSPVIITATKTDQTKGASLRVTVTDLAGNTTMCDPELPAPRVLRVAAGRAGQVTGLLTGMTTLVVRNGARHGSVLVRVNGHAIRIRGLRPHQQRRIDISRWLRRGFSNTVSARRLGHAGKTTVVVA